MRMDLRAVAKWVARGAANVAAVPFLFLHALKIPLLGNDHALEGSTQLLALWPGLTGQYTRRAFLAWTIAECHPTAKISFGTIFSKSAMPLGANVYIGPYCCLGYVNIEREAMIATGV